MELLRLLFTGHERLDVLMASTMKVLLLLLLLLDAQPTETKEQEAVVAPDDTTAHVRDVWKLLMKELRGKGEWVYGRL